MLLFPNAKINIGLNVVRKRADGYHDLETVFYPVPVQDVLETKPMRYSNDTYALQLVGIPIEGCPADNLIVKVFVDLQREFDLPPLDIYLHKRIPTGAGLGGGSSDAAFMLKGLNDDFGLGLTDGEMERRISRYGADCAFFVQNRPMYATGIGDVLTPVSLSLKGYTLVLVKPDVAVSTREAYGGIVPRESDYDLATVVAQPVETWRDVVRNDFETNVFRLHPEIAAVKQTLYDMGAVYAAMSGSGSSVFGLFRHRLDNVGEVFSDCFVAQHELLI